MPRPVEILHYSWLLASLQVTAMRTTDPVVLAEVQQQLEDVYIDIFTLLSHDALVERPTVLPVERLVRELEGAAGELR